MWFDIVAPEHDYPHICVNVSRFAGARAAWHWHGTAPRHGWISSLPNLATGSGLMSLSRPALGAVVLFGRPAI